MPSRVRKTAWSAGLLWLLAASASAADVCPLLRTQQGATQPATRVAAIACNEHILWLRPFIDTDGRIASASVSEAEKRRLGDGVTEAWRRVAIYWRDSGLLWQMGGFAGARDCSHAAGDRYASPSCRAFVVDNPWSAAFVSFVLKRAGVPGFQVSPSHFDYVRDAYTHPQTSPYQYLPPANVRLAPGDLLCLVRASDRAYGYQGLTAALDQGQGGLPMHCEIVTAVNPDNDGKAYLVGGNVHQGVTMRLLAVTPDGMLAGLPQRIGSTPACSPDNPTACNLNRQDWAVLLKLKSLSPLAAATRAVPDPVPAAPGQNACCLRCSVARDLPLPPCPDPEEP